VKAIDGGLLPIAGHKGSGLAFMVELLAGALPGSRVGYAVPGGWGSFAILIDPTIFRPLVDFKNDVEKAIKELKAAPKAEGFHEIYFAGEQSHKKREECLKTGVVDINDKMFDALQVSRRL
jgi:LDH2 family malate/lactate/ureidoglycolate dehydrogenase